MHMENGSFHAALLLLRKKEAGYMASLSSFMKNDACLVRLQFSSFMSFVIGDQLFGSRIFSKNTVLFLIGKVAGNGQYLSVKNTLVSIDGFAVLEKSLEFSVNDDRKRVA